MEENKTFFIDEIKKDIDNLSQKIRYFNEIILIYEEEIKEKYKLMHKICNHKWEDKKEIFMYGEKYKECSICGMCR